MGNIDSYDISYNIYKEKYNADDYMRLCVTKEECKLYYQNTIDDLLDTLDTILNSDEKGIINKMINDDLVFDPTDKKENIIEISVKIITYILFLMDLEKDNKDEKDPIDDLTESEFNVAKNKYLAMLKRFINKETHSVDKNQSIKVETKQ